MKTMADLQTGYQHSAIMTCHLYTIQPATQLPLPSPTDHDVMAHDIISSGTANLPPSFVATQWTFIKSDRTTSGKGCTGTGLGHIHSGWVNTSRGNLGGTKVLLFQSRLNIIIIKLQRWLAATKSMPAYRKRSVALTSGALGSVI